MILAIYTKHKIKDNWLLYTITEGMEAAKKHSKYAIKQAKKFGYDDATATIQGFDNVDSIPKILYTIKPEKLLYN